MLRIAHRRAATLIETLIGAALAAGGLALVAVASGGMRDDAMTAVDAANLMTIGQASSMYQADNNGWLVGAPGTSGRELLNDADALFSDQALSVNGLATQPFDWASPLIPYIAPDFDIPERRDERFALTNGTDIPNYDAPDFDPSLVDLMPSIGPLGVFADPAQDEVSFPYYLFAARLDGIPGTAFQPQLASSYIAAREFLWWIAESDRPRWAEREFWGRRGSYISPYPAGSEVGLPGAFTEAGHHAAYRPFLSRIGNPSRKIFLANGTRYQLADLTYIDHDVSVTGDYGGAFADPGPWHIRWTRTWPMGLSNAGVDMSSVSFRRGGAGENATGHVLYYDNAVELITMSEARRPEPWLPRGSSLLIGVLETSIRPDYEPGELLWPPGVGLQYTRIP